MNTTSYTRHIGNKNAWIFFALWLITFAIYIPAGRSGWVIDAAGWIHDMKVNSLWNFINRTQSNSQSFYQLFALHYFIFYKIWGLNVWMWSLLYITVNAVNAFLLYVLGKNIFDDARIPKSRNIVLSGVIIFLVCPHISEVVIWKACSHYLQGFLFILLTMIWVQKYQHRQHPKYIWYSAVIFVLSAFGLEIFYIIPFFVLTMAVFYYTGLGYDKKVFYKTIRYFFIPQLLLLILYFVAIYVVYKFFRPHKTEINESIADYLSKPVKFLFHIVFLGRYFSIEVKSKVYELCRSVPALIIFYTLLTGIFTFGLLNLKKLNNSTKVIFLLFAWAVMTLFFIMPLTFPGPELLVFYDRYTYFANGFLYLMLALIVTSLVKNKYVVVGLFCIYLDLNLFFTIKVNTYWIASDLISKKLVRNFPDYGNKIVLLLNIPENMVGVPMIGAQHEGIFKALKEVYLDTKINGTIYDVASYNMVADYNGAHVKVLNDSVISVILNHTGTWWWYEGHGAVSYETQEYKVDVKPVGQRYDITLKHPADKYLILYSVGDVWKTVDMSKKNIQQD